MKKLSNFMNLCNKQDIVRSQVWPPLNYSKKTKIKLDHSVFLMINTLKWMLHFFPFQWALLWLIEAQDMMGLTLLVRHTKSTFWMGVVDLVTLIFKMVCVGWCGWQTVGLNIALMTQGLWYHSFNGWWQQCVTVTVIIVYTYELFMQDSQRQFWQYVM